MTAKSISFKSKLTPKLQQSMKFSTILRKKIDQYIWNN
jgi:hypothetical protein